MESHWWNYRRSVTIQLHFIRCNAHLRTNVCNPIARDSFFRNRNNTLRKSLFCKISFPVKKKLGSISQYILGKEKKIAKYFTPLVLIAYYWLFVLLEMCIACEHKKWNNERILWWTSANERLQFNLDCQWNNGR